MKNRGGGEALRMNCSGKETDLLRMWKNFLTNEVNKRFMVLMPHGIMVMRSKLQTKVQCNWKITLEIWNHTKLWGCDSNQTLLFWYWRFVCWQQSQQIKSWVILPLLQDLNSVLLPILHAWFEAPSSYLISILDNRTTYSVLPPTFMLPYIKQRQEPLLHYI